MSCEKHCGCDYEYCKKNNVENYEDLIFTGIYFYNYRVNTKDPLLIERREILELTMEFIKKMYKIEDLKDCVYKDIRREIKKEIKRQTKR